MATADDLLLSLFLKDGTSVTSYGEFTRLDDRVIFSMVTGGDGELRLHAATLPADAIDWVRTNRHASSTRYQAARVASDAGAWEASSAAAGALLLLSRAQQEIRELLELPRLQ